jgi:hypothetical protein
MWFSSSGQQYAGLFGRSRICRRSERFFFSRSDRLQHVKRGRLQAYPRPCTRACMVVRPTRARRRRSPRSQQRCRPVGGRVAPAAPADCFYAPLHEAPDHLGPHRGPSSAARSRSAKGSAVLRLQPRAPVVLWVCRADAEHRRDLAPRHAPHPAPSNAMARLDAPLASFLAFACTSNLSPLPSVQPERVLTSAPPLEVMLPDDEISPRTSRPTVKLFLLGPTLDSPALPARGGTARDVRVNRCGSSPLGIAKAVSPQLDSPSGERPGLLRGPPAAREIR